MLKSVELEWMSVCKVNYRPNKEDYDLGYEIGRLFAQKVRLQKV